MAKVSSNRTARRINAANARALTWERRAGGLFAQVADLSRKLEAETERANLSEQYAEELRVRINTPAEAERLDALADNLADAVAPAPED